MQQRKAFLLSSLSTALLTATLATSAQAASFKAGDVDMNVGGYAKFDMSYFDPGITASGTVIGPGSVPAKGSDTDATVDLSARESRVWFKASLPTSAGTLKTTVEGDFYGSGGNEVVSNSYGFRLRHAFGELNGWLMGQTWSTFMDLNHLGELLDFGQHKSTAFIRQAQIRYTHKLDSGSLQFALENPQTYASDPLATGAANNGDAGGMPDVVARWNTGGDWGNFSAIIMGRQLKVANDNKETAGAFSLTAKLKTGGKNNLKLQLNGGALGRYMGLVVHPGATFDASGKLKALDSMGASAAYQHWWSDSVRSTLMIAGTQADNPTGADSLNKESRSVHLNVLWDVAKQVRLGVEVQRVDLKKESGDKNELTRAQFSARYMF